MTLVTSANPYFIGLSAILKIRRIAKIHILELPQTLILSACGSCFGLKTTAALPQTLMAWAFAEVRKLRPPFLRGVYFCTFAPMPGAGRGARLYPPYESKANPAKRTRKAKLVEA